MPALFDALEREWVHLAADRVAAHRLTAVREVAGRARSLGEVERYVRRSGPEAADRVLLALVSRAVDDDGLAARVLLQLLLPGTRNLARRWWAIGDPEERAAAAVSAVYQRIRTYPLERRPGRVAANILMDAARQLRRAVPRTDVILSDDPAAEVALQSRQPEPMAHAAEELLDVLVDAVQGGTISWPDAQLIARSRIAGERVEDLASHRGMQPRTVWEHRRRAERALAG